MFAFPLKHHFATTLAAVLLYFGGRDAHAVESVTRPILLNGSASHRLTMTIVSEGYRVTEQEQFFQDATNLVNAFFVTEPFQEYQNFFNVQAVFVASNESGSDHPAYPLSRDTYFNSSYGVTDRLLAIPAGASGLGKVTSLLNAVAPETDLPVLLVNDLVYGGSGGSLVVVSRNTFAPEILVHESGHTLAGLGDEYTDPASFTPVREPPNTTRQTERARIKWNVWISTNTPVPTPATAAFETSIGLFEGAQNQTSGWYRPKLDCGMRTLGKPFCEICREALVQSICGKARLVDGFAPQSLSHVFRNLEPLLLEVTPICPSTHTLAVQWFLNGAPVPNATNATFSLDPSSLSKGSHLVRVEVRDPTDWVRNDPVDLLKQTISWRVEKPFPETVKPTVRISAPAQRAHVTDSIVTITGTAKDNVAVASVLWRIGDSPFLPAVGTTSWAATVQLFPGPNIVTVKSVDVSGNESAVQTRILNYVVLSPLHLMLNGSGAVSGATNGQLLEVGRRYRMRARPASGHLFSGWSGGIISDEPALSFTMQSNLVLNANFVVNPFLSLPGEYVGLFRGEHQPANLETSGLIRIKLGRNGVFSGKLSMIERDYPFSGKFRWDKQAHLFVKRNGTSPLQLEMVLDEETQRVTGTVSDSSWQSFLRAEFARPVNADWVGRRLTVALPGRVDESLSLGDGVATVVVNSKTLRISGVLADGARFSQAVPWMEPAWPLFWRKPGESMAFGWVNTATMEAAPFTGEIDFQKWSSGRFYSNGVTHRASIQSSHFQPPTSASDRILNFNRGHLVFAGGNLTETIAAEATLENRNILKVSGLNPPALRLNLRTGWLSGSFLHPSSGSNVALHGVVLQNRTNVAGCFLGTNQTGRISLEIIE